MTGRRTSLSLLVVLLLLSVGCTGENRPPSGAPDPTGVEEEVARALQRTLDSAREEGGSPGAQAAVVWPDGSRWSGASGLADVEAGTPVTSETRFAMGSMMKLHTAALVLDLAEDGALSLDDELAEWIPEFPGSTEITLRQLLLHTSGLARVAGSDIPAALEAQPDHHLSFDELVLDPVCRPGTCYHYQSPDYELLGEVVERATGDSFADAIGARLWEPLGLDDTYFPSQEQASGSMATGYDFQASEDADEVAACERDDVDVPYPCGGGGLLATATDVASFTDELLSGRVLEPASLEQMLDFDVTQGLPGISECGAVGLGLVRDGTRQHGVVWGHGGFTGNFHSGATFYPRYGLTVVAVVNDGGDTGAIVNALAEVLLADPRVVDPDAPTGFCNFDIYLARPDGSQRTRLTIDPGLDGSTVTFSPDGDRIAFGSTRTGDTEIFVMERDGSNQRNLTEDPADDRAASWSPDGTKILFQSDRRGSNDIFVMNADGSEVTSLTRYPADDVIPVWSPDGSRIAYASGPDGGAHDIYVMNADGSKPQRITGEETDEWWPTWSPDGQRIAFVADRRLIGGGGIEVLNVETGASGPLDVPVDGPNFPAWSARNRIAFLDFQGDIWTVAPDGSALRRVTNTGEREFQPAWSPDGRRLAFPGERWVE